MEGQTNIFDYLSEKPATCKETKQTRAESHDKVNKQRMYEKVIATLGKDVLTAREIAVKMWKKGIIEYPARAIIQPRITELVESGELKVVGKKYDVETHRKVAQYWKI